MNFTHKCHFHKSNTINKFCCANSCTLPLCSECEKIHLQEHLASDTQPVFMRFNEAYLKAQNDLEQFIETQLKSKTEFQYKLKADKEKVLLQINNFYKEAEQKLKNFGNCIEEAEQKLTKLKKGSIKTLIYFYAGDIKLSLNSYDFNFLNQNLEKFFENRSSHEDQQSEKEKKSQKGIHTFRNHQGKNQLEVFQRQLSQVNHTQKQNRAYEINIQKCEKVVSKQKRNSIFDYNKKKKEQVRQPPKTQFIFNRENTESNQTKRQDQNSKSPIFKVQEFNDDKKAFEIRQFKDNQQEMHYEKRQYDFHSGSLTAAEQYQAFLKERDHKFKKKDDLSRNRSIQKFERSNDKYLRVSDLQTPKPNQNQQKQNFKTRSYSQTHMSSNVNKFGKKDYEFEMKKQVLSPIEIRKMLEKRIQEKSRKLNINNNEPQRQTKKSNYLMTNQQHKSKEAWENKGWETKDSIVQQLNFDFKY